MNPRPLQYINYGCGWTAPEGWRNFDASPTLRFERLPVLGQLYTRNPARFPRNAEYGDILKGLPIPPGSCKGIYCSHVLEHLSLEDLRLALRRTYDLLAPGGLFRLVMPDLEYHIVQYVRSTSVNAAEIFMRDTCLGVERRPKNLKAFLVDWIGNSKHLWLWDFKSICSELGIAGFVNVRRAKLGDSPDLRFVEVEEANRWENCVGVECSRA